MTQVIEPSFIGPYGDSTAQNDRVRIWGPGVMVDGIPFDAMNEDQCSKVLESFARDRPGEVLCFLKVGFWNPKEPDAPDPNEIVANFSTMEGGEFELFADAAGIRTTFRTNVGVLQHMPKGSKFHFVFRSADSWWGMLIVWGKNDDLLAVLFIHLGRDCSMPLRPGGKSAIETAADWVVQNIPAEEIHDITFVAEGGVGKCCYGFKDPTVLKQRVIERYGAGVVSFIFADTSKNPPNSGNAAMNLGNLIRCESAKVFGHMTNVDYRIGYWCSACMGGEHPSLEGRPLRSNARELSSSRDLYVISSEVE